MNIVEDGNRISFHLQVASELTFINFIVSIKLAFAVSAPTYKPPHQPLNLLTHLLTSLPTSQPQRPPLPISI